MKNLAPKTSGAAYALIGLVILSFIALYYQVIAGLIFDWKNNDNYSHGFFIPLISGYMIYTMWPDLIEEEKTPLNLGLVLCMLGLGQLYVAAVGSELFLQRLSIIPVLFGIALFLFGKKITLKLVMPIAYLVFMVPPPAIIWNKIAFPMQLFSSKVTEEVVRLLGIPIFREGNVLHLAQTTLEVVDACSGLRSLTTMFALSAALAWFTNFKLSSKCLLFFIAAPIAIFANVVRLAITALLASEYGEKAAQGFLHEFSGLFTFIFGLVLLILASKVLALRDNETE